MFRSLFSVLVLASLVLTLSTAVHAELLDSAISVFSDEFNDSAVDSAKWPVAVGATVNSGAVTLSSATEGDYAALGSAADSLAGLGTSDNWAVEVRFSLAGPLKTTPSYPENQQDFILMAGISTPGWIATGVDLRLNQDDSAINGSTYTLGWWGFDSSGTRTATQLYSLNKGQTYKVGAHRKADNTVDIFLNDTLISNMPVIGSVNPEKMFIGDWSSGDVYTHTPGFSLDYVRVGYFIPEPSSIALLAIGGFGLIIYAWRKRR